MKGSRKDPVLRVLLLRICCNSPASCRCLYHHPRGESPGRRVHRLPCRQSQTRECCASDTPGWFLPICRKARHVTNQVLLLYISCPLETVNARYDTNVVIKLTSSYNFKFPCRNSAAIWLRPGIGRVAACGKSSSKQSAGLMSG